MSIKIELNPTTVEEAVKRYVKNTLGLRPEGIKFIREKDTDGQVRAEVLVSPPGDAQGSVRPGSDV